MDERNNKRALEKNKVKFGISTKKKNDKEKKFKSETTNFNTEAMMMDESIESIAVVGKSCCIPKQKSQESSYRLHECRPTTTLCPAVENPSQIEDVCGEGISLLIPSTSFTSFTSAKSDISGSKLLPYDVQNPNEPQNQDDTKKLLKNIENPTDINSTCTDNNEYITKLKSMEKKCTAQEKKIKELNHRIEECNAAKKKKISENQSLSHQVNVLNRQLQALYDMGLEQKNWNNSIEPSEFMKYKNKVIEYESLIKKCKECNADLQTNYNDLVLKLESRDQEINMKSRELVEYKNRTTLEICKLINQIDTLKRNMKSQSELFDCKIAEAQKSMDNEIVRITTRLEDQYQKDLKNAIEQLQLDFEKLAELPVSTIERLIEVDETGNSVIDWISLQNDEDQNILEKKPFESEDHERAFMEMKDAYEAKIASLKADVEALSDQLKEKNTLLDVYESELMTSRRNTSMKLLRSSQLSEDATFLSQLFTAELSSRKQLHKLEVDAFEERVKALKDEILYRAKNEENHFLELDSARKIAFMYKEKYESLVIEWSEKVNKNFENLMKENKVDLSDVFEQIINLINMLKKAEKTQGETIEKLLSIHSNEIFSYQREAEMFRTKINELEVFQNEQLKLDDTIQELIDSVGKNYIKTVEALVTSHTTELSLKNLEMQSAEKQYSGAITSLKTSHQQEVEFLQKTVKTLEESKSTMEKEINELKNSFHSRETNDANQSKMEDLYVELLKQDGLMVVKEETENALVERVKQLEKSMSEKEKTCREEMEDLVAKLVQANVMSSAKDDLIRELEEKLNTSEKLLENSCREVEKLYGVYALLDENLRNVSVEFPCDKGDYTKDPDIFSKFSAMQACGDKLKNQVLEAFKTIDCLEEERNELKRSEKAMSEKFEENKEINKKLEKELNSAILEKNKSFELNKELMSENIGLKEALIRKENVIKNMELEKKELSELNAELNAEKEKQKEMGMKLKDLEAEKSDLMKREELILMARDESEEKNKLLEENLRRMSERMDGLMIELENNKGFPDEEEDEMYSISLQEVRITYEKGTMLNSSAMESRVECQVQAMETESCETLTLEEVCRENAKLKQENENLREQVKDKNEKLELLLEENTKTNEEIITKLKTELMDIVSDRNKYLVALKRLEKENESLKIELERSKTENYAIRLDFESQLKMMNEASDLKERKENEINEMKREVSRLNGLVGTTANELEIVKARAEMLQSEKDEFSKSNQSLTRELEEAWAQRYELEDQLTKLRRENTVLNLHRVQLEETKRRILNMSKERPSVVSWIKIHEAVENIMDEVLALKTSFDVAVGSEPVDFDVPKSPSEMKLVTETLHAQLQNKTILCDELLVQKKTLEKELRDLEELLKQNDSRILSQKLRTADPWYPLKRHSDKQSNAQSDVLSLKSFDTDNVAAEARDESHVPGANVYETKLDNQVDMDDVHFRESLQQEIQVLKSEIQKLEESLRLKNSSLDGLEEDEERELALTEIGYEEEVLKLTKEFEREVETIKSTFSTEGVEPGAETRRTYRSEIGKLRQYFGRKWSDLARKYQEIYSIHDKKRLSSALEKERQHFLQSFQAILEKEQDDKTRGNELRNFVTEVLDRYIGEIKCQRDKYRENVADMERNHSGVVENLQAAIEQAKEDRDYSVEKAAEEHEERLEEERRRMSDAIEEEKLKHKREMLEMEEFWTEKLSECETKCALLKATARDRFEETGTSVSDTRENGSEDRARVRDAATPVSAVNLGTSSAVQNSESESNAEEYIKDIQSQLATLNESTNLCSSCMSGSVYFKDMEAKTDDDKLEIVRERDALKEMVSSLRLVVSKLLNFVGQYGKELSDISARDSELENTLYKSILCHSEQNPCDETLASNNVTLGLDLTNIIHELNDQSILNPSDQTRFELEKCVRQVKQDACGLLTLSSAESCKQLSELIARIECAKNGLEEKVRKVEDVQAEMRKEIVTTKERLAQWERNLEVISEGYGEEVIQSKKTLSLIELKDKIKLFLTEHCVQSPQEINLLEEICKEGDRLQEEWTRERLDLQQQGGWRHTRFDTQIDVADKQLHSLKNFMEEQAAEREQEREAFDKEVNELKETLKARERDQCLQNRTNQDGGHQGELKSPNQGVDILECQVKELTAQISDLEESKKAIESEFQNAVKKIWSLREVIQDLEVQTAHLNEREFGFKKKMEKLEAVIEEQAKVITELREELESCKNENEIKLSDHLKNVEEELLSLRRVADQISPETLAQMKSNLRQMEAIVIRKTRDLEQMHVSSANVSCSSPSEDVSIRDHLDATRCSTPEEMHANKGSGIALPLEEIDRLQEKLSRHSRAEEVAIKCIQDLKMQLRSKRKSFEELQTERDVLLERVDAFLKENSGLKARLEEQRCNAALLQKQLNADLEAQVNRLEVDVEKLNQLCVQKDKQLQDMKEILENTTKALKVRETEVMNKSKEENVLISTLKTDLANTLSEKDHLEESLEKVREKLRNSMKLPALFDSMIEEKNAEIDRLEREVARLSSERLSSPKSSNEFSKESKGARNVKKIKFSEPESFGDCISTISPYNPSIMRNCSDSFNDFRNSTFKIRQPACSSKLESISSIGPLQLSPRGTDLCSHWKTSSPVCAELSTPESKSSSRKLEKSLEEMVAESTLHSQIESKQREISELQLEVDIFKRKLVEMNQELENSRSEKKEMQHELETKEETIRKLNNTEANLLETMESLKRNHAEEMDELQNKLSFEHGKVEKIYEEIKSLEVQKIEIEEAFLSLKEDYNEKIEGEQRMVSALMEKIKELEARNSESEKRAAKADEEAAKAVKESKETIEKLSEELGSAKREVEQLKNPVKSSADAEIQVGEAVQFDLALRDPKVENGSKSLKQNLEQLKVDYDKMVETLSKGDAGKLESLAYAVRIKNILTSVFDSTNELVEELETHRKKVMECSVDDLAVRVQKELLLSAKLDNELLWSIEAKGLQAENNKTSTSSGFTELGGGDCSNMSQPGANDAVAKAVAMFKTASKKVTDLENEKAELQDKVENHVKVIKFLQESLLAEKKRTEAEKERCKEDAKIMELLRVNLEKGIQSIGAKEKELKKEKQQREKLEKELESYKSRIANASDGKKAELQRLQDSYEDKVKQLNRTLESEKAKNQDLRLQLEQCKIERMSEKESYRLLEHDCTLLQEQKENLKDELISTKQTLRSRDSEINLLKRKLNLQEIDLQTLCLSSDLNRQNTSEASTITNSGASYEDLNKVRNDLAMLSSHGGSSKSLLLNIKKLKTCVQRHVQESTEMGEALLNLSEKAEHMRDIIRNLEESTDPKIGDETLVSDLETERKLWELERNRLITDIETLKSECEKTKRESLESCKSNELLKKENTKLKTEIKAMEKEAAAHIDHGLLKDRVNHLLGKYLRAESYRKNLVWQKQYLLSRMNSYRNSENELMTKLEKLGKRRVKSGDTTKKKASPLVRFRIAAMAIVAILRIKFVVRKWQRHKLMTSRAPPVPRPTQTQPVKQTTIPAVVNMYNEPLNPLSYQTHNLFRQPSTRVLRTPPSRDPGLQTYSPSVKMVDCKDGLNRLQDVAKVSP